MSKTKVESPTYKEVATQVRRALHNPDPLARAEAGAWLASWELPVSAAAILIAATMKYQPA